MIDVIIVGSGASAVHAAWPLAEAGLHVLMLDLGAQDNRYQERIPTKDFLSIRREDERQHEYFLGDDFEGIPLGPVRVGAQLTPPRKYINKEADELLPKESGDFNALESGARGGLAAGWGAASPTLTDHDMAGWPISRADLQPHYETTARRVGVCGDPHDDLASWMGPGIPLLPPARSDSNGAEILRRYHQHRIWFVERGLRLGAPRLAMATREFRGRGPLRYLDMEFWADADRAVYRAQFTLEELQQRFLNFEYRPRARALQFRRELTADGLQTVTWQDVDNQELHKTDCRVVVLAAGAIGSARIAIRSLQAWERRLPIVSNPYTYYPCLMWSRLGRKTRNRRHSLTQAMFLFRRGLHPLVQGQFYSYRSLLNFKLVKESPLGRRESIRIMQLLQEYFTILGVHHEDRPGPHKRLWLTPAEKGADHLSILYRRGEQEEQLRKESERAITRLLPRLGARPIKRIDPGAGASIHYAGTLPMADGSADPLTTCPDGSLRGAPGVYIADGSVLPHLPAKGLTFTVMANANRVGEGVCELLQ